MGTSTNAGTRNIVLIGMRASGKTVLGQRLAAHLQRPFVDLDDEVGRLAGCSADELLGRRGEAAFRAVEAQALLRSAALTGHVIATGGGAVLNGREFAALAASGVVIWLAAPVEVLLARAARRPRPPLTALPPEQELKVLLEGRESLYRAAAEITIPIGNADPILAVLQALDARDDL